MNSGPTRLMWVDALRGLAIVLMIQDHAYDWWLRGEFHPTPWGRVTEFLGTYAAPLFLFLMGMALALSAEKRLRQGSQHRKVAVSLLRRGVFLVLQGYALTWLTFYDGQNLHEMGAIDILHCLGFSMIVLLPLVLARSWLLTLISALAVGALSTWAGGWQLAPWLAPWINDTAGISYFPLLPFVTYALAGLAVGQLYVRSHGSVRSRRRFRLALGFSAAALLFLLPLIPPDLGYRFPRPIFLIFSLSVILWLVLLFDAIDRGRRLLGPLAHVGQTAMMAYVMHHLIGFRLFYLAGWVTGHSWQGQYGVFDPAMSTMLLVALSLLLYLFALVWIAWRPRIGPAAIVRRYAPALAAYW